MNKKAFNLLQFIAIAGLVFIFFHFAAISHSPESIAEIHNLFLKNWIYAFMFLSAVRFGLVETVWRQTIWGKRSGSSIQSNGKYLLCQFSETVQYLIVAILSIFISFWTALYALAAPGMSFDLLSIWYAMQVAYFEWIATFAILSFVRLGIICFKRFLP